MTNNCSNIVSTKPRRIALAVVSAAVFCEVAKAGLITITITEGDKDTFSVTTTDGGKAVAGSGVADSTGNILAKNIPGYPAATHGSWGFNLTDGQLLYFKEANNTLNIVKYTANGADSSFTITSDQPVPKGGVTTLGSYPVGLETLLTAGTPTYAITLTFVDDISHDSSGKDVHVPDNTPTAGLAMIGVVACFAWKRRNSATA
jgi:hypothetical protein